MATTLSVITTTPCTAIFELSTTDNTAAQFLKSGASGNAQKDLTSLHAGPLKAYLDRLAGWADVVPGSSGVPTGNTRIRWRWTYGGDSTMTTIDSTMLFQGIVVVQYGPTGVTFIPSANGPNVMFIEMAFVHSAVR
jgi:hypothetical protein